MQKIINNILGLTNRALDAIFLGYPERTSIGIVVGLLIETIIKLFYPFLSRISNIIDFSGIEYWNYIIVGITIVHVKTIYVILFNREPVFDENTEKAFALIREAKNHGASDFEVQRLYLRVCESILENTILNEATEQEIKRLL